MNDKKRLWHTVSGVIALVLVAIFLIGGGRVLGELRDLRREVGRLKNNLEHQISNVESSLGRQIGDINSRLDQGESLFSDVKTTVDYQGGQLVLTVSATPKTLTAGDTLTLVLGEGSAPLEGENGMVFFGSISFLPAEEIAPILVLTSGETRRQETLDTIYPKDFLSLGCSSQWDGDHLTVSIGPSENFAVSDLMGGDFTLEILDGGGKTVSELPLRLKNDDTSACATTDLSAILAVPGSYQIHLTGRLGGLSYACTGPLASFDSDATDGSSGNGSGDNQLDPIFQ